MTTDKLQTNAKTLFTLWTGLFARGPRRFCHDKTDIHLYGGVWVLPCGLYATLHLDLQLCMQSPNGRRSRRVLLQR